MRWLWLLVALGSSAAFASAERIADAWYAHHALLMTLGAGDRIVATVNHPQSRPWMFKVQPSLNQAQAVDGTAFNVEELLAHKVDLVFTTQGDRNALAYRQAGIPVVYVGFTDIPSMQQAMLDTAQALGSPQAVERANAYNAYLDEQLHEVHKRLASLAEDQRPRVLHIASLNPLKVDGADTLVDTWIGLAGGRNAATGLKGNLQVVSAEQVLAWDPDVVIVAANAGEIGPGLLQQLRAVKAGHVLRNPDGVFPWDRYGTELALQVPWAAQQLHPQAFADVQMVGRTIDFYRRFFGYALSEDEARRIVAGLGPE